MVNCLFKMKFTNTNLSKLVIYGIIKVYNNLYKSKVIFMFTLSEIKDIRRKYVLKENGNIETTGKEETKSPSEMTTEEKSYIESALFLYRHVKMSKDEFKDLSDEDFLRKMQVDFTKEALSRNEYTATTMDIAETPSQVIWRSILSENNGALTYFNRMLAENGKKLQNFEKKGGIKSFTTSISYDLIDDSKGKFLQSLNPNNPQYTQNSPKVILSPEDRAKRRAYVEKAIQYYDMMEHDAWYQQRIEKEEKNMQRVANIVNNNGQISTVKNGPELFRLLKAAKNLSIEGETDYLEEVLSQRAVHEALVDFKKSEYSQKMRTQAIQNQQEGKINSNGLLEGHSLSKGEKENHSAQVCIRQNPNAVNEAKQIMAKQSHIEFGTTTDDIRLSNLYSLIARTQGKIPTKAKTQDTIVLDTDTGKEK